MKSEPTPQTTQTTTSPDRISFEERLGFCFDTDGLLIVSIANVQHVLMPEEADQLRDWLFAQGEEFAHDL
jgi:hypothetical protein